MSEFEDFIEYPGHLQLTFTGDNNTYLSRARLCGSTLDNLILKSPYMRKTKKYRKPRHTGLFWIAPYAVWRKRGDFSSLTCPRCFIRHALIVANDISIAYSTGLKKLKAIEAGTEVPHE